MAMFTGSTRIEGSRSHTHLIKSGHMSPAQEWLVDPTFNTAQMSSVFRDGVLVDYEYGGEDMRNVVIPQGRVVGVGKNVKDFVTKKQKTTLTLPGMALEANPIGMVPYNIAKDMSQQDRFGGNQPSIITLDYVTLPYIPSVTPSTNWNIQGVLEEEKALTVDLKMPWGAVIGAGIQNGSYVKATPSGRLTKWIKGTDDAADIVGQVLATEFDFTPRGWYEWMLWDAKTMKEDDVVINRSGASNLPSDGGWPYDPNYGQGNTAFQQYQLETLTNPTGVPGIHDGSGNYEGYGIRDTEYKDMEIGEVPEGVKPGSILVLQAKGYAGDDAKNLREVTSVKIDSQEVDVNDYTVNYTKGKINITLTGDDSAVKDLEGKTITATYKCERYGTPDYLDFKGVVGATYVLLKR